MPVYTPIIAGGSTNGKNIAVAATTTPGTAVHTADATAKDELYIWASNNDTVDHKLTLELGGTGASDILEITIPPEKGEILVLAGRRFTGSVMIAAFADSANKINLGVNVNRIT